MRFEFLSSAVVFAAVVSFVGAIKDNAEPLLRRETPAPHSPHEQHEKIERQAQWAERLERHEHGPSSAHEHTETRFEGHGQRSSQRLEQLQIDLSEAIRYAKANQTEDTPEADRTTCWRNTFIADWGSTGARIFLAHNAKTSDNDEFTKHSHKPYKIMIADWMKYDVDASGSGDGSINQLFAALKGELSTDADALMAAMATAGNRLQRQKSKVVWKALASANAQSTPLFQGCDNTHKKGCRTLPGATEAEYEYAAAYPNAPELSGMISAGGASLQMTFKVGATDQVAAEKCVAQISAATQTSAASGYVENAARYHADKRLITLSWLAVRFEDTPGLFAVGGSNEMRASFDRQLVLGAASPPVTDNFEKAWVDRISSETERNKFPKHPCLRGDWPTTNGDTFLRVKNDTTAEDATGACPDTAVCTPGPQYLSDKFDSFLSVLHGDPDATTETCGEALKAFVEKDFMTKAFLEGDCKKLATNVTKWKLLSGIGRTLKDMGGWNDKTGDGLKKAWKAISGYNFEGKTYASKPVPGTGDTYHTYYDQALLMTVLEVFGIVDNSDHVEPANAEWLLTAGRNLQKPLALGWLKNADCGDAKPTSLSEPSSSSTAPASPVGLSNSGWAGGRSASPNLGSGDAHGGDAAPTEGSSRNSVAAEKLRQVEKLVDEMITKAASDPVH